MDFAICGETVDVIIKMKNEEEFDELKKGSVICSSVYPMPFVRKFKVNMHTMQMNHPILPGSRYNCHIGLQTVQGTFYKLMNLLNSDTGKVIKRRPRCFNNHSFGLVEIKLD